jgi:hypothetical protein
MTGGDESEVSRLKGERDSALGRAADAERKAAGEEARWRLTVQQAREARDEADAMRERYRAALKAIALTPDSDWQDLPHQEMAMRALMAPEECKCPPKGCPYRSCGCRCHGSALSHAPQENETPKTGQEERKET